MVYKIKNNSKIELLFNNWQETLIWSCQQDVMGHLYTTSLDDPQFVMALVGDFCFFAGKPDKELVSFKPQWCQQDFVIMTPQSKEWSDLIEGTFGGRATKVQRYAIKKEMNIFDADKLKCIVASICGAKLILECLDRGLYPSWDAQNMGSVALAEKLGYHFDHAYDAYEIQW
ncbi:MAG: GNAT family N-acetyltransferase [Lachnospiraceae bacterium]|nr:GNAT family N-acetyltransferase [Lachnospiraceae bacterium]